VSSLGVLPEDRYGTQTQKNGRSDESLGVLSSWQFLDCWNGGQK
jgi:hypothetical protein